MLHKDYLRQFETSLFPHSIFAFETLNVLDYACPSCQASDRTRLYKLYMDRYLSEINGRKVSLLDIAPDPLLAAHLRRSALVDYRSANITGKDVDDAVDITDMALYENDKYDFIVCSHVLEHVSDDLRALRELYRVLRPGGQAILMVPILLTILDTDEDPTVVSPQERMARFGQDDHVRLYSKNGFLNRLGEAGFVVDQYGADFFGAEALVRQGVQERAILYVGRKPLY